MTRNATLVTAAALLGVVALVSFAMGWLVQAL